MKGERQERQAIKGITSKGLHTRGAAVFRVGICFEGLSVDRFTIRGAGTKISGFEISKDGRES